MIGKRSLLHTLTNKDFNKTTKRASLKSLDDKLSSNDTFKGINKRPTAANSKAKDGSNMFQGTYYFNFIETGDRTVNSDLPSDMVESYCQNINRFYPVIGDCINLTQSYIELPAGADTQEEFTIEFVVFYDKSE